MTLTEDVSTKVTTLTFDALPQQVRDKAKLLVLDLVGCMIAGSRTRGAVQLMPHLTSTDSGGNCRVFGTSLKFHPGNAAHANANNASMLTLDDSYVLFGHPGSSVIPAALAVAEEIDASGKDLITAIVGGYEMSLRLGAAIRPSENRDREVKGLGTWQIFGACTAAGLLHRFDADQMADAYGLVPMHAPLPFLRKFHSRPMSLLKNNYGWANKGAIMAVDLVRTGFHGNRTIFDGDDGFWIMAGSDRFEPEEMLGRWGERYFTIETGFRAFGVCRWIHTSIDSLRSILARDKFDRQDIERVQVETVSEFVRDFNGPWPESTIEAAFHIPYALALELHDKSSSTGLREEDLGDEELKKTATKIRLSTLNHADDKFYSKKLLPARVTVILKNGETLSAEAEIPTGAPGGPAFGQAEVEAKFLTLATPHIGQSNANHLMEALLKLEALSVREALQFCATP
ncbi:MmgE/PrpD family protein [Sinorhizobium terangae]|uniref:MmgE/PrpD family protein n=1 Tax=Sinorhizobium terangae TaxID=110322 RepID=UPI0024B1BE84|nr:MmgE/PrpD family protein [Sinorhizobium terangae]WFU51684.1 MmgE/PrpD family protein [Sinorhizobium terangae]WFU52037.1 MmgE/PrpD family protein [Sinorhizobium terangae]